jgi:membrane protease YdiL (CAAX protease family)
MGAMVSQKPWSVEAAARLFITVLLTLFLGLFLANLAETPKLGWSRDQRDFVEMVLMTIFFQCSALFWIRHFLRAHGLTWGQAFFPAPRHRRAVLLGLGVGAVATPVLWLLQEGLTIFLEKVFHYHLDAQEVVEKLGNPSIALAPKIFLGATAILLAPMAEEALFRGVLYPTIKQQGYPRLALWFTSLLFAVSHVSVMAFVPLALFSIILIRLYEATDNLLAPMAAHSALNTINFVWIIAFGADVAKNS